MFISIQLNCLGPECFSVLFFCPYLIPMSTFPHLSSAWLYGRIQVFHCLRHEGTGGRTLLVDGFYSANRVLEQSLENFELLSRVPIKHEFIENLGTQVNHMIGIGPVLSVYPWNNEVYMMRYKSSHILT